MVRKKTPKTIPKAVPPVAKGKKRLTQIADDDKAIAEFEKAALKPVRRQGSATHHRDEVSTREILEIVADEIEEIGAGKVNRLNARDYYAMNLIRPLRLKYEISFRDQEVPHSLCKEHDGNS